MQNVLKIRDSELYFVYSGEKFISDLEGRCDVIAQFPSVLAGGLI